MVRMHWNDSTSSCASFLLRCLILFISCLRIVVVVALLDMGTLRRTATLLFALISAHKLTCVFACCCSARARARERDDESAVLCDDALHSHMIDRTERKERERTKKYSHIVRLSIFAGCITAVVSQHVSVFAISRFIAAIGRPVRPCLHGHEVSWKKRTSVRVEYSITKQHIEIERTMYIYRLAYIYICVCVKKRRNAYENDEMVQYKQTNKQNGRSSQQGK